MVAASVSRCDLPSVVAIDRSEGSRGSATPLLQTCRFLTVLNDSMRSLESVWVLEIWNSGKTNFPSLRHIDDALILYEKSFCQFPRLVSVRCSVGGFGNAEESRFSGPVARDLAWELGKRRRSARVFILFLAAIPLLLGIILLTVGLSLDALSLVIGGSVILGVTILVLGYITFSLCIK